MTRGRPTAELQTKKDVPMPRIARAILSCHDKTGLVELAEFLAASGVEMISGKVVYERSGEGMYTSMRAIPA